MAHFGPGGILQTRAIFCALKADNSSTSSQISLELAWLSTGPTRRAGICMSSHCCTVPNIFPTTMSDLRHTSILFSREHFVIAFHHKGR